MKREKKEIVLSESRDFKGIWIYKNLYLSREYTPNEKFLLLEIYSLSKGSKKQCFANNRHFADFIGVKENTVQKAILKLEKNGHIIREYTYREGTKEINGRIITLTQKFYDDFVNESQTETEIKEESGVMDKNPQGSGNKSIGGSGNKSIHKYNNNILSNPSLSIPTDKVNTSDKSDGEVHTSFSEKTTERAVAREDMLQKEKDMVRRFNNICDNNIDNPTINSGVKNGFEMYMQLYEIYFHKVHPILTDETLKKVCNALSTISDTEHGHFDVDDVHEVDDNGFTPLQRMISNHFTTNQRTNFSITHFANAEYLSKLANRFIDI